MLHTNDKRVARRYAKAFLHDSLDRQTIDTMTDEFKAMVIVMDTDEKIREFFTSPVNSKEKKLKVFNNMAEKLGFSKHTRTALNILIRKERIDILADVYEQIRGVSDDIHKRIRVIVTTAYEPDAAEIREIAQGISTYFSREAVIERNIDPSILGGFVCEGEGRIIDMSVKGQIERVITGR